jgi:DNA-binding MarR family transcriptional regulator
LIDLKPAKMQLNNIVKSSSRNVSSDVDESKLFVSSTPAESAMAALMGTAKLIYRFRESKITQHKRFGKLSGSRMGLLFTVHSNGGRIRMGDLASKLGVAARTVTGLVDGLERDGYLHRVSDPSDRRAFIIELSAQTKKQIELMFALRSNFIEEIFSPLTESEVDLLTVLLKKITNGPIQNFIAEPVDNC